MIFRVAAVVLCGAGLAMGHLRAADDAKPKYTIKQVMKTAHKDGLMKKLAGGKGNKEDAAKLLELYQALGDNKPPKGDADSWKSKTTTLIQAAQDVVDGKDGAGAQLEKAANCAACHKLHKGS
jgi:hypothetical protein